MFQIYWTSEDGQGCVFMGAFETRGQAEASLADAKIKLLAQALDDTETEKGLMTKSAVEAGSWSIEENGN